MESVSHSSKRTSSSSSTAAYNGVKSKTMNDDLFGGPPRFGAAPAALSPRLEDYAEIFGGFHASTSSRSSSIPVLDLPSASHYEFDALAPSAFEYSDVFGGFNELDFAVSYEDLLRMMMMGQSGGQDGFSSEDDDDDDVWTVSEAEYPSEGSNVKNHRFSNGDLCESADGSMEFSILYHKAGRTSNEDLSNGITQITQKCAVPENSFVVDRSSSFSKTDDEYLPYKVSNGLLDADFSGEMISGRLLRKTLSQPANGGADESLFSNKVKPLKRYVRNGSFPNETFVTISDVSLRTRPSNLPPPQRPPPALDNEKIGSGELHSYYGDPSFEGSIGDTSPSYFDVEADASSSAAASAAAMRETMKKAQAKLKTAKELMERKREGEQTCRKSGSKKSSKDREGKVIQASDDSSGTRDERLQSTSGGQENRIELPVFQEKQKVAQTTQLTPDSVEMKISETLTKKYAEKQGRESLSSQGSAEIDGAGEWKEATQYFELVKMDKVRKPFDQASDGNIWLQSVSINELEKKGKRAGTEGLERNDMNKEAVQAKSQLERNNVRSKAAKVVKGHQELDNTLSVEEASRWDENDEKLRVDQLPLDADKKESITDSVQKHAKRSESKKISKQNRREPQTSEAEKCIRGGIEKARLEDDEKKIKMSLEQAENERLKEALEQEEKKQRIIQIQEPETNDKKQKEAYEREENEKRVKEALELEESKRRQKEVLEKEAKDRKIKETREKEESERKGKEAAEREESEKREREAQEREEKEKRMKETIEREGERRHRELVEQEEKEKKQIEFRKREKNEKMLTEALEREKTERRINEAATREENEKRQREYREREEKENRLREAFEQEENKKKEQEDREQEESQRRNKEASENEDGKRRIKEDLLGEDIGKGMEEACEKEENGKTPRAAGDGRCGIREKEACEPEETANRTAESHNLKSSGRSEAVTLNGTSNMGLNHHAIHSDFKLGNTELLGESRVTAKHESGSGKVETGIGNEENLITPTELRLREKAATLGSMNEPSDRRTTVMGKARGSVEVGGNKLPSEESATENLKKAGEVGDTIEQRKFEQNINASPLDSGFGHPGNKATHERNERGKNMEQAHVIFSQEGIRDNSVSSRMVKETDEGQRKKEVAHSSKLEMKENVKRTAQNPVFGQTVEGKVKNLNATVLAEEKESGRVKRDKELEQEQERLRKLEEEREREREREKDRMAVDRSTLEGHAYAESRERAERAAVERIMNEARERLERACAEARGKLLTEKAPVEARLKVERAAAEARERAFQKAMAERASMEMKESSGLDNLSALSRNGIRPSASFHYGPYCMERSEGVEGESPQRCKARMERHQRTAERAAKALAEKNMRDLLAQREQAERNRLAETLDADVKRWSSGKEGNLRALLSTLQYILGPDSGWQPVPLTEVITAAAVKKVYRKATLCVHPDKLQQRGASIQQKYICEKVFDLLKEAWNRFNSEER